MKTLALKEKATPSTSSQASFNKKGEGSFLSSTNMVEHPFSSPNPGIQRNPIGSSISGGHNFANIPIFPPRSQPVIQPKLTINEPGDKYEQEADAMAERVMRMTSVSPGGNVPQIGISTVPSLQRKCATCEEEEKIQRAEMEEEEPLQTKPLMRKAEGGGYTASPQLQSQLNSSKGGGSPLPNQTLGFMNQAFGTDFSSVRIHSDSRAAEMSQGIQAKAFTHGSDIYFNRGQYNPESSEGKRLLGHELTHALKHQQNNSKLQKSPTNSTPEQNGGLNEKLEKLFDEYKQKYNEEVPDWLKDWAKKYERLRLKNDIRIWKPINVDRLKREIENYKVWGKKPSDPRDNRPWERTHGAKKSKVVRSNQSMCGAHVFAHMKTPWYIPDVFVEANWPNYNDKKTWKANRDKEAKGSGCLAEGEFKNIKLSWDLGNPNLGSFRVFNINKNSLTFDMTTYLVIFNYSGKCCDCFEGLIRLDAEIEVERKKGGHLERGKAKIGNWYNSEKCNTLSNECCLISENWGFNNRVQIARDITVGIKGKIFLVGETYGSPL